MYTADHWLKHDNFISKELQINKRPNKRRMISVN